MHYFWLGGEDKTSLYSRASTWLFSCQQLGFSFSKEGVWNKELAKDMLAVTAALWHAYTRRDRVL